MIDKAMFVIYMHLPYSIIKSRFLSCVIFIVKEQYIKRIWVRYCYLSFVFFTVN